MSPAAAIQSEIFRFYVALVAAVLVTTGLALAILRAVVGSSVSHAWAAYRGWLIMAPLVLACVFLGRETTILFLTAVAALGFRELARASELASDRALTAVGAGGIAAVGIACLLPDPVNGRPGWYGLFTALPVYVVAAAFLVPIVRNRPRGQLRAVALVVLGFTALGFMFGHLALLANARHAYGYLLFLFFAVEISDVAAYVSGRLLGRRPLRSEISPGKTWEGAAGGLAVALALPWLLRFSLPAFDAADLWLTGLIVGVAGPLGDLSVSLVKRELGVKNLGALIPGHGGILDRVDSLIYAAPLFVQLVRYRGGL
jgi:phosphatidate cytidylyltransferase